MSKQRVKLYPLEKSPLYRLRNRKKLAKLLHVEEKYFYRNRTYNYYKTTIPKKNGGHRIISNPPIKLKKIQSRIRILMQRIETPDWMKSGKKRESYITNSLLHIDSHFVRTMDISAFYDSVKRNRVYNLFRHTFQMEEDIAAIMVRLVMDGKKLPTGAPTSQLIAFWAYKDMFSKINEAAERNKYTFSLYVDDMTFSSNIPIPYSFREEIAEILHEFGLNAKREKDKYYGVNDYKIVTGVALKNGAIRLKNKHRKEILDLRKEIKNNPNKEKAQKLIGKTLAARQIEPNIFPSINIDKIRNTLTE